MHAPWPAVAAAAIWTGNGSWVAASMVHQEDEDEDKGEVLIDSRSSRTNLVNGQYSQW